MRRTWLLAFPGIALVSMGAHPAPKGSEVTVVTGHTLSEYRSVSNAPAYRYVSNGLGAHAAARVRFDNNLTLAAQLGVDHGIISGFEQETISPNGTYDSASNHVGDTSWKGATAMRVGWHDGIIGGELGVAIAGLPETEQKLYPSALGWVGVPKFAYVWGATFAGPITRAQSLHEPMVGVGHRGDFMSIWWGTHVETRIANLPWQYLPVENPLGSNDVSDSNIPFVAGVTVEVSPGVRLGIEYGDGDGRQLQTVQDTRLSMVVQVEGDLRDGF